MIHVSCHKTAKKISVAFNLSRAANKSAFNNYGNRQWNPKVI